MLYVALSRVGREDAVKIYKPQDHMNPNHMRNVVYKEIFDDNLVVANSVQEGYIPSANDMQVQDNIENDDTYIQPAIGENGDLVEEIISNMDML